jgi:Na+/H+ antiporter NhaD/arsenite permease-like protein
LSAVIDNVPLVAASMGMYEVSPAVMGDAWLDLFVQDGTFWHFLAYTAGTGGSILIIGSAAGVAVMGIEKISFTWYLRNIAPWALLGYLAGCLAYIFLGL